MLFHAVFGCSVRDLFLALFLTRLRATTSDDSLPSLFSSVEAGYAEAQGLKVKKLPVVTLGAAQIHDGWSSVRFWEPSRLCGS